MLFQATIAALPAGAAEYRIGSGDVLEISVAQVPDMQRRARVGLDGTVAFPTLGQIPVAGRSLVEIRETIETILAERKIVRTPEVSLELVESRPFFIDGDVSKPGAHPYYLGMTVRHAVAVAGGYDVARFRLSNPTLQVADLSAERTTLAIELVKMQARARRLEAELNGQSEISADGLTKVPGQPDTAESIAALEQNQLRLRQEDFARQANHLRAVLSHTIARLTALQSQLEEEEKALVQQNEDLERLRNIYSRGLANSNRLSEDIRAVQFTRSRLSEVRAQIAQTEREIEVTRRDQERLVSDRRAALLNESADVAAQMARLGTLYGTAGTKLTYVGALRSQLVAAAGPPDVTIFRQNGDWTDRLAATEDTVVLPGDMIRIGLMTEKLARTPDAATSNESERGAGP